MLSWERIQCAGNQAIRRSGTGNDGLVLCSGAAHTDTFALVVPPNGDVHGGSHAAACRHRLVHWLVQERVEGFQAHVPSIVCGVRLHPQLKLFDFC